MKKQQQGEGVVSAIDEDRDEEENYIHGKDEEEHENDETMEDESIASKITVSVYLEVLQCIVSRNHKQKKS
eukprot:7088616-Ditylum_brightwellii.AAC.1